MASNRIDSGIDYSDTDEKQLGGQMSFLDHLDELRRRLVRATLFLGVSFLFCWFVSDRTYNFLARPIERAIDNAERHAVPLKGLKGNETIQPPAAIKENDQLRFIFTEPTRLGPSVIPPGASVQARAIKSTDGRLALFTDEAIFTGDSVIPKGIELPFDLAVVPGTLADSAQGRQLTVTTAIEPFSLYVKVSLYAALCLSIPFILWQVWAFISPGLYPHERGYALPFVLLSSISFIAGAAFAYYIIFPPAAAYLLGLGGDFKLLINATTYFDFILLIMLGMGLVFQMPAITYVLARIGLVTAGFLLRAWKIALIVILIVAAVVSPTNDIPNMMLFAAPMIVLYIISIFIAWMFGRPRRAEG